MTTTTRQRPGLALRQVATYLAATYTGALALALALPEKEASALLTILVPVLAVVVTIRITTPKHDRRAAWGSVGFRRPRSWYLLVAVLGPVCVATLSFGTARLFGVVDFPPLSEWIADEAMNVLIVTAAFAVIILGEEIGWRGYLQPRLLELMPIKRASVVTGACHAAFHLPLLLLTTNYQSEGSRWVVVPTVMVTLTLAGVWYGWLRARSGSIWTVSLSHSAFNGVMESIGGVAIAGSLTTMAYVTTETGLATLAVMAGLSGFLLSRPDTSWVASRPGHASASPSERSPS